MKIHRTGYGCPTCKSRELMQVINSDLAYCPNRECEDYFEIELLKR